MYSIVALVVIVSGYIFFARHTGSPYQFITVTRGSIEQTVSVTGNTTPTKSVSLGFQNTGTIAHLYYSLGDRVAAGAIIAELNTASLSAAFAQAQANLAVAQANLAGLTAGTRPEQLAIDQNAVMQDQIALRNVIMSAYAAADTAVHNTADQLFINPRTTNAALTVVVPDANLVNQIVQERSALEPVLANWNAENITAVQASENLTQITVFLNDLAAALAKTQPSANISATTLSSYASAIAAARTSVTAAASALTAAQSVLTAADGALALAQAGPTPQAVAAGEAQVAVARASVASARAALENAEIVAPIGGTIIGLDAKVGQLATPGTPLVAIIGTGGFEVDVGVSETDIGKLTVADAASMTLDALPNETFTGKVFYIAPAQTNTQGVITYLIKISFDKPDARFKSGLTTNVTIESKRDDNVLILPQYAILQNDSGTFVEILSKGGATTSPVTLGIQDQKGNVEVLRGVSEGEQVINIGLKPQ